MATKYALRYPVKTGDTSKPIWSPDSALTTEHDGVRFSFDLGAPMCWPGGPIANRPGPGNPANGSIVHDILGFPDGRVALNVPAASVMTYAGGGFDLSGTKGTGATQANPAGCIYAPASVLADIWTPYGEAQVSQRPLLVGYFKLPAAAAFPASTSDGLANLMVDRPYSSAPSMAVVGMAYANGRPVIQSRRQTLAGIIGQQLSVAPAADSFGELAQIAYWRNGQGQFLRVRTVAETLIQDSVGAVGSQNTQDFSGNEFGWGRPGAFSGQDAFYAGAKLYRGWLENLGRSGRDPVTVLDLDWARVQARIAASAAKNGGASQVFN